MRNRYEKHFKDFDDLSERAANLQMIILEHMSEESLETLMMLYRDENK